MSITTYAELVTAIQTYSVDVSTATAAQIDDAIRLAESRIFVGSGKAGDPLFSRPLRCRAMERQISLIVPNYQDGGTSGGTANAQTITVASIPSSDALAFTFTAGFTNTSTVTLTVNGSITANLVRGLNYDPLEAGDIRYGGLYAVYYDGTNFILMPGAGCVPLPSRFMGGRMMFHANSTKKVNFINSDDSQALSLTVNGAYAIEEGTIRFVSVPAATVIDFRYYRKPQPLISALNDIFREAPNLWLYGALVEIAVFLQHDTMISKYYDLFMSAMQGYMQMDAATRSGTEQYYNQAYPVIV